MSYFWAGMENKWIATLHLFQPLEEKLIELLRSLSPADWEKPTVAKQWTVRDVAAHLLDGNFRVISRSRDGYVESQPVNIQSIGELTAFLNKLNADFVKAMKRISPRLLTELMETTGTEYTQQILQSDMNAPAPFAVSWSGEQQSANWFHIAREYTERWHHQQQIRDAVDKPGIMTQELYYPVLDTFMRALPYSYRNTDAPAGSLVKLMVAGEGGGNWLLEKKNNWELVTENEKLPGTEITIDANIAWKLFTKSWRRKEAAQYIQIKGDEVLAAPALEMVAVMA